QTASQVVSLLMQHMQVELQGRCWAGLAAALQGPAPQDLLQMRAAHQRYLATAREVCLLPPAPATGPTPAPSALAAPPQPPLSGPLMAALQGAHAMATVLRRALEALETQAGRPAGLSAAPRQPTVAP
ncbi:hypothetical protein Agub_g10149, partial [Astrephomene gubernaculifera]